MQQTIEAKNVFLFCIKIMKKQNKFLDKKIYMYIIV